VLRVPVGHNARRPADPTFVSLLGFTNQSATMITVSEAPTL
jgi:hypothetical protein